MHSTHHRCRNRIELTNESNGGCWFSNWIPFANVPFRDPFFFSFFFWNFFKFLFLPSFLPNICCWCFVVIACGRVPQLHKWKIVDKRPKQFGLSASLWRKICDSIANVKRFRIKPASNRGRQQQQPHFAFRCVMCGPPMDCTKTGIQKSEYTWKSFTASVCVCVWALCNDSPIQKVREEQEPKVQ